MIDLVVSDIEIVVVLSNIFKLCSLLDRVGPLSQDPTMNHGAKV